MRMATTPVFAAPSSHPRQERGHFVLSCDPGLVDLDSVHAFLTTCYWSPGITRARVARAIQHSIVWGVYDNAAPRMSDPRRPAQAAFLRVITDRATFAYLCDVFVLEAYRGRGLSRWMLEAVLGDPALQGLRRFSLLTRDAHALYAKFGFVPLPDAGRYMERLDHESYKRS